MFKNSNRKKDIYEILIELILYFLLAFAFFQGYFIHENGIGTSGPRIFLMAIFSLSLLIIFYYNKSNQIFAIISIIPFTLTIFHIIITIYVKAADGLMNIIKAESNILILLITLIIFLILSILNLKN